jgi:hypothetical protein
VLFEVIPFLLFLYFAVRMGLNPLERFLPTVITIVIVGTFLGIFEGVLSAYQNPLTNLVLTGSFVVSPGNPAEPLGDVLGSIFSPIPIVYLLQDLIEFTALGITGIAFGYFAGMTPGNLLRSWLDSRGAFDIPESEDAGAIGDGKDT